ncbi:MAG: serine/threonine-protein kinase [Rudaea sp.]|nr:serine/threonine-protein kinase [Rudaea sp.]
MQPSFGSRFSSPDQPTVLDVEAAGGDPEQTLPTGLHLGPYRIERLLGEGGMGAVYLVEQLEPLQRRVALKLIRGQLRGGMAEAYFLVERQALARMDHPAIAKVYDAGTTPQGHPFFAMEWIDGQSLAAYCATRALSLDETLALFALICLGVHHAHQKGVIHRDLKPNNVLVAEVDGRPLPKIIDFGIALGATQNTGGDGMPLMERAGTRGYMSPEQIRGNTGEIDIRSDVYALGVMLLELLAPQEAMDRAAAEGLDNRELHTALLASLGQTTSMHPDSVRELAAIPAQLRWVLARAIDPDRSRRYESAQALAEDVDRYRRHYPLSAVPPTRRYRLRAFAVRNRGPILAVGLIAMALIAGTTAAIVGMLHARAAAERATIEANKSRETSRFLTDVLSGVDPGQARDLDKTLLHLVLDRAANRAGQELARQPEVLADIEKTIGSSYNSLSEYKTALAHTQQAYDLARKSLGPDALLTLQIERQLARQTLNNGNAKEAAEIIARNFAALSRTRGADDPETLRSAVDVADVENEKGDFPAAEHRIADLLPTIERVDGHDGLLTVEALNVHAELLTYLGRYSEAETIFRDLIDRETRALGAQDPKTIEAKNSFAIMYLESHRYAEGAKILQDLLPVCEKMYGPEHGMTLNIVSNLAGALRQQGTPEKIAESGPYYKRALDGTRKKYGERHPNVIRATHNYANYLLDVGDTAQAVALQQQVVAQAREVFGPEHEVTGEGEFGLGKALLKAGRYAEAEQALLAAIAEKQKDFGADHWRLGEYMTPLIQVYEAWGKPQQAAQWEARRSALKPKPAGES